MEEVQQEPLPPGDEGQGGSSGQQPSQQQQFGDQHQRVVPPPAATVPPPGFGPAWYQQQLPWFLPAAGQQAWTSPSPPSQPQKVKLPPFWHKDATAWFNLADSIFDGLRMAGSVARYQQVLMALPTDVVEKVRGVINAAAGMQDPYMALRERVIEMLAPNTLEQLNSIIWGPELGGQRPSELMEAMLANLPAGEADGLLFKALFLHRLPADIRDLVALQLQRLQSRELAAHADSLWFARNAKRTGGAEVVAAVADSPPTDQQESELVAAIKQLATRGNSGGRKNYKKGGKKGGNKRSGVGGGSSGGGGGSGDHKYVCFRHSKFGDATFSCEDPHNCTWVGNE